MEWIHCNDCYKQMAFCPGVDFFLTPCTKIQCSECSASNSCAKKNCQTCRNQNFGTVRLDDSMPSAVSDFFRDPMDHLKKFLKVNEFQSKHRNRLLAHQAEQIQEMAAEASLLQRVNNELKSQSRQLQTENHVIREENARLKAQLHELESRLKKDRNGGVGRAKDDDKRHHLTATGSAGGRSASADSHQTRTPLQELPASSLNRMPAPSAPGPIRRSSQAKQKTSAPFLNMQTPSYFPSGTQTPIQVPRQMSKTNFVTPIRPSFQSVNSKPERPNHQQEQKRLHQIQHVRYQQVYSYMAAAAREALTPEQPTANKR